MLSFEISQTLALTTSLTGSNRWLANRVRENLGQDLLITTDRQILLLSLPTPILVATSHKTYHVRDTLNVHASSTAVPCAG